MTKQEQTEKNRENRMKVYANGKGMLQRVSRTMDRVLAGETETTACLKENVDKSWMRRFLKSDISIKKEDSGIVEIDCDDWMCWQDQFLTDLTGQEYYAPDGFDQIYQECTEETCSEQEREVLRLRYRERLTLQEAGERTGKSPERVRQIEIRALRALRHPKYRIKLMYGPEYAEVIKKATSAQAEYDKARMARMKEIMEERKEAILECRKNQEEISRKMKDLSAEIEGKTSGLSVEEALDEIPISEMGLSVRAYNALEKHVVYGKRNVLSAGEPIKTVGQLSRLSHMELCNIRNLGVRSVSEIEEILFRQYGIQLSCNNKKL